jgi:hypothetical protein
MNELTALEIAVCTYAIVSEEDPCERAEALSLLLDAICGLADEPESPPPYSHEARRLAIALLTDFRDRAAAHRLYDRAEAYLAPE